MTALIPLLATISSPFSNVVVANTLSLALLASLSTAIGIAFQFIPNENINTGVDNSRSGHGTRTGYSSNDWILWTMLILSFSIIVTSLILSFYLVLLPQFISIISLATKCTTFSMIKIIKAVDILPIVLHGCISIGIGMAFMWSTLRHVHQHENQYNKYKNIYKTLQRMAWLIHILAFFIIVISLLLALWSSITLFNVDTLKGFEALAPKYSYQYSWCR